MKGSFRALLCPLELFLGRSHRGSFRPLELDIRHHQTRPGPRSYLEPYTIILTPKLASSV